MLLLLGAAGCERRAPGLLECNTFGRRVLGIPQDAVVVDARAHAYLDALTAECVIVPCSRQLLGEPALARCVRQHTALEESPRTAVRACCSALERLRTEPSGAEPARQPLR